MNNTPDTAPETADEAPLSYPSLGGLLAGNVKFDVDDSGHVGLSQGIVGTYNLSDFDQTDNGLDLNPKGPSPISIVNGEPIHRDPEPVQTTEIHESAPSLKDLVESGALIPEGKGSIANVFDDIITQLKMFLADEHSGQGDIVQACEELIARVGPAEGKRQIGDIASRLAIMTGKISGLLAAIPARLVLASMGDQELLKRGGDQGGSINIPGYGVSIVDKASQEYMNLGATIPAILISGNHLINIIDWKKSKVDDGIRESIRLAVSIAIFLVFYDHPTWMKGGAAGANEILGLFAMYGGRWGPIRDWRVRYPFTMITQFLATWGLL